MHCGSVVQGFEMGCPELIQGEQSPEGFILCPPDGLFLSTATLIFPSVTDCFSLLQISRFVSRAGKAEMVLLPEKEHPGTVVLVCEALKL